MSALRCLSVLSGFLLALFLTGMPPGGWGTGRASAASGQPPREAWQVYEKWPFGPEEAKRRQKETAEALGVPRRLTVKLGDGKGEKVRLVLIPAGEYMMGGGTSPEKLAEEYDLPVRAFADELPRHRVRITEPFYMSVTEVTMDQIVPYRQEKRWEDSPENGRPQEKSRFSIDVTNSRPAVYVTWTEARDFCRWVGQKADRTGRLPTEAEWEYACRAGTDTAYYFGDDPAKLDEYGWHKGNSDEARHQVGQKKQNRWGLHDMAGNAGEWCHDWYGHAYYEKSPTEDPQGPSGENTDAVQEEHLPAPEQDQGEEVVYGKEMPERIQEKLREKIRTGPFEHTGRVLRGGAYDRKAAYCRSAFRHAHSADDGTDSIGFRVVLSALPETSTTPEK